MNEKKQVFNMYKTQKAKEEKVGVFVLNTHIERERERERERE